MNPGPGSYDAGKAFGTDGTTVTIRDPSSPNLENKVPGPGAYAHE
jgi:Sperm-tail PG-rich repeat